MPNYNFVSYLTTVMLSCVDKFKFVCVCLSPVAGQTNNVVNNKNNVRYLSPKPGYIYTGQSGMSLRLIALLREVVFCRALTEFKKPWTTPATRDCSKKNLFKSPSGKPNDFLIYYQSPRKIKMEGGLN